MKFAGKWPAGQVDILIDAFKQFIANCGHSVDEIRSNYAGTHELLVMYHIFSRVSYDLQNNDNHPAYHAGQWEVDGVMQDRPARKRIVRYNPQFQLYPAGCNDNHREAVLRYVGKQVGLIG